MKDTTNYNNAIKSTEALRESYGGELKNDAVKVLDYYGELIKLADTNKLTQREACYLIADTMWYTVVDKNPGLEAIAGDAGELELPDEHIDGDRAERWARLKTWIQEEINNLKRASF